MADLKIFKKKAYETQETFFLNTLFLIFVFFWCFIQPFIQENLRFPMSVCLLLNI